MSDLRDVMIVLLELSDPVMIANLFTLRYSNLIFLL